MKQESKENFKTIHIGKSIRTRVEDLRIPEERISNFLNITEKEIKTTYESESVDSYQLLRWSKLLEYDFFRLYSQHLILYAPSNTNAKLNLKQTNFNSPKFKKNIYTKEIIDFILELLDSGNKTRQQIIDDYNIPKTTLYKWISKYSQKAE